MDNKRQRRIATSQRRSGGVNRRTFMAAATAAASAGLLQNSGRATAVPQRMGSIPFEGQLAFDGGTPIRTTMLLASISTVPGKPNAERSAELRQMR
jgi:hypothetical protein